MSFKASICIFALSASQFLFYRFLKTGIDWLEGYAMICTNGVQLVQRLWFRLEVISNNSSFAALDRK